MVMPEFSEPTFALKVNGVSKKELLADVLEIVVDTSVFMPSMFSILIQEKDWESDSLRYMDDPLLFFIGAMVEITAKAVDLDLGIPSSNTLIKGEVTSIEPVFMEDGRIRLRIRGYDRGHRLTMGTKTRTFGEGTAPVVTEMMIVAKIAGEYGLIPKIDPVANMYKYVMQYNQSDWDFLWARAQAIGYQVYVEDRVLNFVKAGKERGQPVSLTWGHDLKRFEPRVVSLGVVTKATVRGWDESTKREVTASASSDMSSTVAKIPAALVPGSKQIMVGLQSRSEESVTNAAVNFVGLAKNMAEARFAEHESSFVRASGEVLGGSPNLVGGTSILVKNIGPRFSGKYYVTEARHIYRRGEYTVQFQVSGRNPYSIRHLLLGNEHNLNKIDGVVTAIVTDVNDPTMLGRIKVKFPWLSDTLSSGWARLALPGAGPNRGVMFMPEVNDEVLVAFEQGDASSPYVVGALYNTKDRPPTAPTGKMVVAGKVNQRVVRSRTGHVIVLDDTPGQEKITIQDKTGKNSFIIDSVKNSMDIKVQGNLTIDVGGKFTVNSKMDILLDTKTKAAITAQAKLDMQGQAGAVLKSGASALELQPATAALKSAKVDVQGQAQTNIQGVQTSVKGTAMVEVQGALVKIN